MAASRSVTPSPRSDAVDTTGGCHRLRASAGPSARPSASIDFKSEMVLFASGLSHLLTTCTSAISRMPALIAWMSSPSPGGDTTTVDLVLADADGLNEDNVEAGRIEHVDRLERSAR